VKIRRIALLLLPLLTLLALSAGAVEIVGRVTNATTGQPVPGQFVNLLALRGQMVPIRETETNSEGRYRFVVAANPSERFLVQVPYRGVTYSVPAAFGAGERITADVTVYDAGAPAADISLQAETIFFEPHSGHVRVLAFYAMANRSRPPRAYAPDEGSFRFAVPGPVGDLQVTATRASGMPLRQQPQPTDKENVYAVNFPLHPGETEFQVSYALPMSGSSFEVRLPLLVQAARRHLAVPRQGVKVEAAGLREIAQTQAPQARVYVVAAQAPGDLKVKLTVDAAALAAAAPAAAQEPAAAAGESNVSIVPHPVNRAQWYIVGLSLIVLSLGLYYLNSLGPAPSATDEPRRQPARRAE